MKLTCHSSGETRWFFNYKYTESIHNGSVLVIESVRNNNSGVYYCYGQYHKKFKYFLAKAKVYIMGELTFCLPN